MIDSGRRFALSLILEAEGSTPRDAGVKAIIDEDGRISGTLGGGLVEAEAQRRAVEACQSNRPVVYDVNLQGVPAGDGAAVCGGRMRILIDPTAARHRDCYHHAAEALRDRKRGVLLTTVRSGDPPHVNVKWYTQDSIPPDADFPGTKAIRSCLARETCRLYVETSDDTEARREVLVEPVIPQPRLLIVGGGHVGQALARQAALVAFDITVIDDRPEFTEPALFPEGVTTRYGDIGKEVAACPIAEDTYVVVVTRAHSHDAEALEACIHAPAAYIGMIGSRRKVALIRKHFIESGLATQEQFDRVFAPVGLDIGAVTVPEIATSIVAQLVAVRRKTGAYARAGDMAFP